MAGQPSTLNRNAPKPSLLVWALPAGLAGYHAIFALQFYVTETQRLAHTAFIAFTALAFALTIASVRLSQRSWNLVFAWGLLAIVPFFPAFTHRPPIPIYIIGDFSTVALPLLLLVIGLRHPAVFRDRPAITCLTVGLLGAAFLGTISDASGNARHVAPASFLIASVWTRFVFRRGNTRNWTVFAALAFISFAAISSGFRSAMVHIAMLGTLTYFLKGGLRTMSLFAAGSVIALVILVIALPQHVVDRQIQAMRISSIVAGAEDASISQRFNEAHDVLSHIRKDWGPLEFLFGAGHGAAFVPIRSNTNNITDFGTVHHIHATPVLLLFRYGVMGAAALIALCWFTARRFLAIRSDVRSGRFNRAEACLTVAMIAYLADSLKHGVLVDPVFSYCVAGMVFLEVKSPTRTALPEVSTANASKDPLPKVGTPPPVRGPL